MGNTMCMCAEGGPRGRFLWGVCSVVLRGWRAGLELFAVC